MPALEIGLFIGCVVAAAVSLAGLIFWLKVTKMAALKITGWYIGVVLGYSLLVGPMTWILLPSNNRRSGP